MFLNHNVCLDIQMLIYKYYAVFKIQYKCNTYGDYIMVCVFQNKLEHEISGYNRLFMNNMSTFHASFFYIWHSHALAQNS